MPDEARPLFGRDADDLGNEIARTGVEQDTTIVREALRAIWVEGVINNWLEGRNAFLDGARPIDVLAANDLTRVMDAVSQEIEGGFR